MTRIALVQTTPDADAGSMTAYGHLVRAAVAAVGATDLKLETLPFFRPSGGSMWAHHLWRIRNGTRLFRLAGADLFHVLDGSMAGFVPPDFRSRTVVTVHDLIPALQREGALEGRPSLPASWVISRGLTALRQSRGLCAVSDRTRVDTERLAGRADCTVIHHAIRPLPPNESDRAGLLPERFLLHIGNNAPYKNRRGALEAFRRLTDDVALHLVMAGPPPDPALQEYARGISRVHFLEQVDDQLLYQLYRRARVMLFPSWYEGFGMPVMEAMAAGCPVVCSTGGALAETAGDAALTAEPGDYDQMAAHCRALLRQPELRTAVIDRGYRRASRFTLASMGENLVRWYRNCIATVKTV